MLWSRPARTRKRYFSVYEWTGSGYRRINSDLYNDREAAIAAAAEAAAKLPPGASPQSRHLHVLDDGHGFVATVHAPPALAEHMSEQNPALLAA